MLPHKFPFVMVDKVIDFEKHCWIKGSKYIAWDSSLQWEDFHIMLCESCAQLSKILEILSFDGKEITVSFLTSLKMEFVSEIIKGENVILLIKYVNSFQDMYIYEAEASIETRVVLRGTFSRKIK